MWALQLIFLIIVYQEIVKANPLDLSFGADNHGKGILGALATLKSGLVNTAKSSLIEGNAQLTNPYGALPFQSGFSPNNEPNPVPSSNQQKQNEEHAFSETNTNGLNHQSAPPIKIQAEDNTSSSKGKDTILDTRLSNLPRDVEEIIDLEITSNSSKTVETHPGIVNKKKLISIAPIQSRLKKRLGVLTNGVIGVGSSVLGGISTVSKIGQTNLENLRSFGETQLSTGQQVASDSANDAGKFIQSSIGAVEQASGSAKKVLGQGFEIGHKSIEGISNGAKHAGTDTFAGTAGLQEVLRPW